MKKFNLIISTVERPNKTPYLDWCIDSIRKEYDGEITLMIGGNPKYAIKHHKNIAHVYLNQFEKEFKTTRQKAGYGYYRALTWDPKIPALIFEDDGILEEGWYEKLQKLISYVPYEKYMLSLISPSRESVPEPDSKVPSIQMFNYRAMLSYTDPGVIPAATIITYSNTTGMYYPVSTLQSRLAEFVYKYAVEGDAYYDIVVGQFMFRYNLPIYIAVPNLLKSVDTPDSSLGSEKKMSLIDYSKWDFTK